MTVLLFGGVLLTLGCKGLTVVDSDDAEALQLDLGRFKVIRTRIESNSDLIPYRKVEQKIYVDGKEWILNVPDKNYADGIEKKFGDRASCSTGLKPNIESYEESKSPIGNALSHYLEDYIVGTLPDKKL